MENIIENSIEMIDGGIIGNVARVFLKIKGCRNVEIRMTIKNGDTLSEVASVDFSNQMLRVDDKFK